MSILFLCTKVDDKKWKKTFFTLSAVSFAPNKMVAQVADNGFENNLILKKWIKMLDIIVTHI